MNIFKNKNVLIFGLGKSGKSALSLLKKVGAKVFVYDDKLTVKIQDCKKQNTVQNCNPKIIFNDLLDKDAIFVNGIEDLENYNIQFCILSPGVDLENTMFLHIKNKNIKVMSELELGTFFCRGKIFALTGTNGKTTSVNLLTQIFLTAKQQTFLCGNVGTPICDIALKTTKKSLIVCEVSSYQLETTKNFKPFATAILNIQPDHLNRHKTLENYSKIKNKLNGYFKSKKIFNIDDAITKELSSRFFNAIECSLHKKTNGCYLLNNSATFKVKNFSDKNFYVFNNNLLNVNFKNKTSKTNTNKGKFRLKPCLKFVKKYIYYKNEKIMPIENIKLLGKKNLENILCVVALARQIGVQNQHIQQAIENFKPLPHRLELVDKINGITFINDSKSTNILSTLMALDSVGDEVILLLGGSDKGLDFSPIFSGHKIRTTIAYGEVFRKIESVQKNTNFISAKNFNDACEIAFKIARQNDIVLLSPACASFDEFSSYEERGERFKKNIRKFFNEFYK